MNEPNLTPREQAVIREVVRGARNREIAASLAISEATVKEHLTHAFAKLGVASRTQAIAVAHRTGLARIGEGA